MWLQGAVKMGDVEVVYKIMPNGIDVNIDKLSEDIRYSIEDFAKIRSIEVKPVAFGLKSIEVNLVLKDAEGETEKAESAINKLEDVQSVETLRVGLLL